MVTMVSGGVEGRRPLGIDTPNRDELRPRRLGTELSFGASRGATVRVGVIGRGFGERVVAVAFDATDGCEVVDVVTPRDAAAVAALCVRKDVDLISVHSPPFLHVDHVRLAVEAGHAVLCDKPFGRNAREATEMCDLARDAGVLGFLNFENRYDPARQRVRALLQEGAIAEPEHVQFGLLTSIWRVPLRRYGWLFDDELGGGWLRALGSHLIDFTRWTFGEVVEASGQLRTAVTERPDADGKLHRCTADDGFVATLRSETGVTAVIDSSSAASANLTPTMVVVGSKGTLEATGDNQIRLHTETGVEEIFTLEAGGNSLLQAMQTWAGVVRDAVHEGTIPPGAPTFADGLAWNEVLDRLRG
jgi:predicted dehydrogenase